MAISNKEKLAYVLKYAPKSDEKIQKIIRLAATMDNPKSKLTPEQKDKVKEGLSKLYSRFQEINEQKKGQTKSTTKKEPYFKKALQEFKQKVGKIEYKRATSRTDIKKDIERPALKAGKRFPKEGKTTNQYGTFKNNPKKPYWENRANRMDVNQPSKSKYPKLSEGGQTGENFKVGDRIKVLGDSYTILSFKVDKSQGYDEQRVVMKNDKGEILSYPLDMVVAYSKYAQGGYTKRYSKDEMYKIRTRQIHDRTKGEGVGNFELPKDKNTRYLFALDDFDQNLVKGEKLKPNEHIFRFETETTKIGGFVPFVKINLDNQMVYFLTERAMDEDLVEFQKKGQKARFINISDKYKNGGTIKYAQGGYTKRYSEEDFPYLTADDFHKISEKISEDIDRKEIEKHRKLGTHEKFTKWWYNGGREKAIAKYGDDEQTAWSEAYEDFKRKGEKARFINISDKYENGGNIKYAQGGVFEHGLYKGDKIVEVVDDKYLVIESENGVMSVINIEEGGRFILGLDDSKDSGSRKDVGKVGLDEAMQYINYVKNQKMSNGGEIVVSDIEKKKSLKGNAKLKF
jgi:hypothetical protein